MEELAEPPGLDQVAAWERLAQPERETALAAAGIGDGLPTAPVTTRAVEQALERAGRAPDEVVATLPPLARDATAEAIAVCALLAGCEARHLPLVLAAVEGVADPAFNALAVLTTTGTTAVATVVHGPAGAELNSGPNLLGPGHRANATIGRALSLALRVVGGAVPGLTDMATMGQPGKYTFCFAENEAASPWEPLHAARGVPAGRSAVTVFAASGTAEVTDSHAVSPDDVLGALAGAMYQSGSLDRYTGLVGGGRQMVLLAPEWASILGAAGMSRRDVAAALAERAVWPVADLPAGLGAAGLEATAVRALSMPDDLVLAVAGGHGIKHTLVPGWAGLSAPVTVPVRAGRD
jgi:hypothetical protein